MAEILRWVGDCFQALAGLIFFLVPGILFWLVVIVALGVVRWFKQIYQVVRDKARESVKPVIMKEAGNNR